MDEFTEQQIASMIKAYKNKRARELKHYQKIKDTQNFKDKNRARAKAWYDKHKEVRQKYYEDNIDFRRAKSSYYYYKRNNRLAEFELKHPAKYNLLKENGYFNEQKPEESTSTSYSSSSSAEPSQTS